MKCSLCQGNRKITDLDIDHVCSDCRQKMSEDSKSKLNKIK